MAKLVRVLFVCVGNSCRSQMAEALARHHAPDIIEATSAGLRPLGYIANATGEALRERGVALNGQFSKGLRDESLLEPADLIINISGVRGESLFAGRPFEDWYVDDPFADNLATYRRICDDIESRVRDLAARLRARDGDRPTSDI